MSLRRLFALVFAPLVLAGALVPVFASAQQYNCSGYPYNVQNCTPGVLHVFVQVLAPPDSNYPYPVRQPGDFAVTVTGQNASPSSFSGSASGTNVSVGGSYNVVVTALPGYTPTYSVGCSDSVVNGQNGTCLVSESQTAPYYSNPQPYPYPYTQPAPLQCAPAYQTVSAGEAATFTALGPSTVYNWTTADRTYLAVGSKLTTTLQTVGLQTVVVGSGAQSATCTVNVTAAGLGPITYTPTPVTSNYIPNSYATPSLPNTGFEPRSAAEWSFALVVLIAISILSLPYVRKTFAALGR